MTAFRFGGGLLALALGLGCGIGDYEQRIDEQHRRIKMLDEEAKALGDVIALPGRKENEKNVMAWPFDVFLRLPNGTKPAPAANYTGLGERLALYKYAGPPGYNTFVAAGLVAEKSKDGSYRPNEWTPADFRRELMFALKDYYAKEYKSFVGIDTTPTFKHEKRQPYNNRAEPMTPLPFDVAYIADDANADVKEKSAFAVFHYVAGNKQVGVVYQMPKARMNDELTRKAVDYSVKSLDAMTASLSRQKAPKS